MRTNRVGIVNRQRQRAVDRLRLGKVAAYVLRSEGVREGELSLVLVSDRGIRELNRRYLGMDRPTDVLSFSQSEGEGGGRAPGLLGDVVISVETAQRQAQAAGVVFERELDLLLVHGILHLLGYEHTGSPVEARKMNLKQRSLVRQVQRRFPAV